jgi:NAD(P)-dependent dehydrogenase (short-subunit alcohol dehydrogenase family)
MFLGETTKITPISELVSLKKRRSVITGAASGIGRAIATRFAEAGSDLELVDIDEQGLKTLKEELSGYNVEVNLHKVDLYNKQEIDALWERLSGKDPDILINNAGMFPFKDFLAINEEFLKKMFGVNLNAYLWMCQQFIKRRESKGGVIVNTASVGAILTTSPLPLLVHYDATKAAVISMTRDLAAAYGKKGFKINAIAPGGISTAGGAKYADMLHSETGLDTGEVFIPFMGRIPVERLGEPDDIARMILVLACNLSSFMQGAIVPVDGGFLCT